MREPTRVQLSRRKGWRMPDNTVKVDRTTRWGNPFIIGYNRCTGKGETYQEEKIKDAATAVRFFCEMIAIEPRNYPSTGEIKEHLAGKNLACWCRIGSACHADVLLELAAASKSDGGR